MTNKAAVKAYLEQQGRCLPEYLQGVITFFTLNLMKLIEVQQCADPDLVLEACFLPFEAEEFQELRSAFIDSPALSGKLRAVMGPVYKIQGLLFDTDDVYKEEFSQFSAKQVEESKRLVAHWAKGVLAAWKQECGVGDQQLPRKVQRVVWADNPLLKGGPKPLTTEYLISNETVKVQKKNGD